VVLATQEEEEVTVSLGRAGGVVGGGADGGTTSRWYGDGVGRRRTCELIIGDDHGSR